jgi:UDP-N-acetylglucosamine diphosphorylase/glucosamine-1-phosphate N-acetyltransferase
LIAAILDHNQFNRLMEDDIDELSSYEVKDTHLLKISRLWDIYLLNEAALSIDFNLLTARRQSQPLSSSNFITGKGNIFLEEGARVEGAFLNASAGPIYLGKNAEVMEGAMIRGPFALGDAGVVKLGAKVYGGTSAGPGCVIGGELKNVVIMANSSKGHDGYLGNSVIGEWCNLGADTNCSNLKNTWSEVKIWDYTTGDFESSGQLKAGLFMGDYSMCSINSMFNTGTIAGICCNIFGGGFSPKYIPSFSWGGNDNMVTYVPEKAFDAIDRMMQVRNQQLTIEDRLLLIRIFEETSRFRGWEQQEPTGKKFYRLSESG